MIITVSEKAQRWFEQEMGVSEKRGVRFLGKVYGCSPIHEGFSLAVEVDEPQSPIGKAIYNDITYFVEAGDEWFFEGYHLHVSFDEQLNEPRYEFESTAVDKK